MLLPKKCPLDGGVTVFSIFNKSIEDRKNVSQWTTVAGVMIYEQKVDWVGYIFSKI